MYHKFVLNFIMENYLRQEIKDQIYQKINQDIPKILQKYEISSNKIQIIIAGIINHCFLILNEELKD